MTVTSLLYVSRSRLALPGEAGEVDRIVATARRENARLGVTGALLFTEVHFAQILEGEAAVVHGLMERIAADPRHFDINIVSVADRPERNFPGWSMAYSGPSLYVDRQIKPLLARGAQGKDARQLCDKLVRLMREFAAPPAELP